MNGRRPASREVLRFLRFVIFVVLTKRFHIRWHRLLYGKATEGIPEVIGMLARPFADIPAESIIAHEVEKQIGTPGF